MPCARANCQPVHLATHARSGLSSRTCARRARQPPSPARSAGLVPPALMQPPESASERIISNSELPIWLQQTDTLRPASRELPLSPRKSAESRLSGRRLSNNSRGELFPAAPAGRSEATALSDGRRLSSSRGELLPAAVPSEPTSSEAELTPRRRAARAPPNPFEASWDSLEAFKRCTLSRLAGEGTGSSSAGTQAYDFSRGAGCGGSGGGGCLGEAATAARIARRASREGGRYRSAAPGCAAPARTSAAKRCRRGR